MIELYRMKWVIIAMPTFAWQDRLFVRWLDWVDKRRAHAR